MKQKKCPNCNDIGTLELIPKKWWMRLLPKRGFYRCFICGYRIFEWANEIKERSRKTSN